MPIVASGFGVARPALRNFHFFRIFAGRWASSACTVRPSRTSPSSAQTAAASRTRAHDRSSKLEAETRDDLLDLVALCLRSCRRRLMGTRVATTVCATPTRSSTSTGSWRSRWVWRTLRSSHSSRLLATCVIRACVAQSSSSARRRLRSSKSASCGSRAARECRAGRRSARPRTRSGIGRGWCRSSEIEDGG